MTTTAKVLLDRAFINLADDVSQYITFGTSARNDTQTLEGNVRSYANGVERSVTGSTDIRVLAVTARALLPEDVRKFILWRGKTVFFRDTYGRGFWGVYYVTSGIDIPLSGVANDNLLTDITFTIQKTSYVYAGGAT